MYVLPVKQSVAAALRTQFPTVTIYHVDEYTTLEPKAIRSPAIVVGVPFIGMAARELGSHTWDVHVQHYVLGAEEVQRDYLLDALYRFWYHVSLPVYQVERGVTLGDRIGTLTDTDVVVSSAIPIPDDTTVLYYIGSLYVRGLFYPA